MGMEQMKAFERLLKPLLLVKARKMCSHIKPCLKGTLLDVGAGRCYISSEIEKKGTEVTCLDVKDLSQTEKKVATYDGRHFPFKDNEFDSCLIAYVLHHCEYPEEVLEEAKRVAKSSIIIFEDTKPSIFTKAMDFFSNRIRNVGTPFKFKSSDEWRETFKKHGLKLLEEQKGVEKEWFYPLVEHTMFVLGK